MLASMITIGLTAFEYMQPGADPGFLERGFMCIKVLGLALLILSHFFKNIP